MSTALSSDGLALGSGATAGGVTVACGICYAPGAVVFENPHGTSVEVVGPDGANPYPMLGMAVDLVAL